MNMKLLIAALASLAILGGCTQQAQEKYDKAGDQLGKAADKTGEAVATDAAVTGEAVGDAAENAAEAAENASKEAGRTADAAGDEFGIKNAILAADGIDASDLNVEVENNKVILKGSVPTADQKKRAGDIAQGVAGKERQVDNQLTVGAGD